MKGWDGERKGKNLALEVTHSFLGVARRPEDKTDEEFFKALNNKRDGKNNYANIKAFPKN